MHISLDNPNKAKELTANLRLNLGFSWLVLSPEQLTQLGEQLAATSSQAWQLEAATWQEAKQELTCLAALIEQFLGLAKKLQAELISRLSLANCLALARYSRQELPNSSTALVKAIHQGLATKSLKAEFNEYFLSSDKSNALEVAAASQNLLNSLAALGIKPKLAIASNQASSTTSPQINIDELNKKASNYLNYLSNLPSRQIKVILRQLAPAEVGWLVSACKTLQIEKFNQQLAQILPTATWKKLDASCPAELALDKLNQLLASLGLAFKHLQQELQQGQVDG